MLELHSTIDIYCLHHFSWEWNMDNIGATTTNLFPKKEKKDKSRESESEKEREKIRRPTIAIGWNANNTFKLSNIIASQVYHVCWFDFCGHFARKQEQHNHHPKIYHPSASSSMRKCERNKKKGATRYFHSIHGSFTVLLALLEAVFCVAEIFLSPLETCFYKEKREREKKIIEKSFLFHGINCFRRDHVF